MNEATHAVGGIVNATSPISLKAALAAGVSAKMLRGKEFRRIQHGIYVSATVPDSLLLRARAALMAAPTGALVSHQSAAELWGGVVPRQSEVHLSVASTSRWSGPSGVAIHSTVDSRERGRRHGLPVTSPEATFLDLARYLELVDLVVLGDSLVRCRATTTEKLVAASARSQSGGAKRARHAAGLVRKDVDSPQETRTRLLIVFAGLPEPVVNFRIFNDDGTVRYRCDLAWPELRISVEYDGRQHAEEPGQWGAMSVDGSTSMTRVGA